MSPFVGKFGMSAVRPSDPPKRLISAGWRAGWLAIPLTLATLQRREAVGVRLPPDFACLPVVRTPHDQ